MNGVGARQLHSIALALALAAMMSFVIWGGTAQAESGSGSDGSGPGAGLLENSGSGSGGDSEDNSGSGSGGSGTDNSGSGGGNNVQLPCDGDNSGSYRDVECVNGQPAPTEDGIGDFNRHIDHFCPNPDVAACNDPVDPVDPDPVVEPDVDPDPDVDPNPIVDPDPVVDPNPIVDPDDNPEIDDFPDGFDNDADGEVDEADPIEVSFVTIDGLDNDADGAIDEADASEQVAVAQTAALAAPLSTQASSGLSGTPGTSSGGVAVTDTGTPQVLPSTGGPALLVPMAGLFLVAAVALGLLVRRFHA